MTYILSREAGVNLREIEDYTARKWGGDQRERYLREIFAAFEKLAQRPGIGRSRPDIPPPNLVYTVRSHLIIYRHNPKVGRVEVLNVLHPAMDIEKRLSDALRGAFKGSDNGTNKESV